MTPTVQRGGANVGWLQASWPFASLRIEPGALTLSALGRYRFQPSDIVAIESVGAIPVLTTGLQIHHSRPDYPEKMIFYSGGSREALLRAAQEAGFAVGAPPSPTPRGSPVRMSAIIATIVIWNALFLMDMFSPQLRGGLPFGPGVMLALALAFLAAALAPRVEWLRQRILRPGRHVGEIRGALHVMQFITGVMLLVIALVRWQHG